MAGVTIDINMAQCPKCDCQVCKAVAAERERFAKGMEQLIAKLRNIESAGNDYCGCRASEAIEIAERIRGGTA